MDATTRIDKIADLLEKCWSTITQITLDWPRWAEFQYLRESDWRRSEPIYQASNLSSDARELYELTRRNIVKQEINRTMFGFVTEQQRVYYYEYLREFLREVNRISEGIEQYFDQVDDSQGVIWNKAIKYDVSLITDAILEINYTLTPFLPAFQKSHHEEFTYPVINNMGIAHISSDIESKTKISVTQASLALFYYYCHEKKCLSPFPAGKMEQAYKEATAPYNLSWKSFQIHYNKFSRDKEERFASENRTSLENAIRMLAEYPEALELAKDELNIAETRNPIT